MPRINFSIKTEMHSALKSIFSVKLRSFLAILGVLVGTASVVAMVSGGELATRQALKQISAMGSNLFSISITNSSNGNSGMKVQPNLTDIFKLYSVSPNIVQIAPYSHLFNNVYFQDHKITSDIVATTNDLASLIRLPIFKGRFLSFAEKRNAFCVIGHNIYQSILAQTSNPIGKQILVGRKYYTIVGIANHWNENAFVMADLNNSIIVPIETAKMLSSYASIGNIVLSLKPKTNIDQLESKIRHYFKNNFPHTDLYFHSAKQILESMKKEQAILTVFLGFIGSISLVVGGIGIMNIMLVSVVERKKEIGIRLAVGAKPRNIALLFLIESVILTLLGGILGVLSGILISFLIAFIKQWDFTLFLIPPLIGFVVSVLIGIFFGFYPALKAAQLDPIDSLRME